MTPGCSSGPDFDIIVRNGTIVDGLGGKPYKADVGIVNDKIKTIADLGGKKAKQTIDATGLMVCPGFIDLHTHSDRTILKHPDCHNYIRQGVTLSLAGNCGSSKLPIGEFFEKIERKKIASNFMMLVGHNSIRRKVMGNVNRPPTPAEMEEMKRLVSRAMQNGAAGMSTGLKYLPGTYAKTNEIIELAKVVGQYGGIYATHMREEGIDILKSVNESIAIGRAARLPVQISHHKVVSVDKWGSSKQTLELVDNANKEGLDVTIDQYPYPATSTTLLILFPSWAKEGEKEQWPERWADPVNNKRLKADIRYNIEHDRGGSDLNRIMIARFRAEPELEGLTIAKILEKKGLPDTMEAGVQLIIDLALKGLEKGIQGIYFCLSDDDIERIMKHPLTAHASDGSIRTPDVGNPHPRNYGTFPRVLKMYVREKGILTFEEAVRKMTSLPADRLKLSGRGRIKEGCYADIAIIDAKTVADTATWSNPHSYPTGIPYVLVNGEIVIEKNSFTNRFPGKVIRGTTE